MAMRVLGIETSCDETGVAIYDSQQGLLTHQLYSQVELHARYGGVVPELASRDHVRILLPLIDQALQQAHCKRDDIDGIAYTAGPGLMGALLVGACLGRSLAFAWQKPAVGVHHMEGHLLAVMLEQHKPAFPFVALLVSGGHTMLVHVHALGHYEILGESIDDAAGEAFDKTAKLLGLGYPGGAALAKLAEKGNPTRFNFPRPLIHRPTLDFSFSGLKTAVRNTLIQTDGNDHDKADIAASFQQAVVDTLVAKTQRALQQTGCADLVVAGGVGANQCLRDTLQAYARQHQGHVYFPRHEFCTDNGAMIAYVGCQRLLAGNQNDLHIKVVPRWPISDLER